VFAFLVRRIAYGAAILIGINIVTFLLFFQVNSPDDMARLQLGGKRVTTQAIQQWKAERGYDRPMFFNERAGGLAKLTDTCSSTARSGCSRSTSDAPTTAATSRPKSRVAQARAFRSRCRCSSSGSASRSPSRSAWRSSAARTSTSGASPFLVAMMSISALFFIVAGQFVLAKVLQLVPISGFEGGADSYRFLLLPIAVGVVSQIGPEARFYRTIFLEEIGRDYVRTARSKGLSEPVVLFRHVLRNALIPILTRSVVLIPLLFMGA
jgi:peptide/nickel transport system permease protein